VLTLENTYALIFVFLECFQKLGERIGDGVKESTWQYYLYNPRAIIAHIRILLNIIQETKLNQWIKLDSLESGKIDLKSTRSPKSSNKVK
jgi:hypothetical protein